MTLIQAINRLKAEYRRSIELKWVNKPLAYALYQTWRWADENEKEQK